MESISLIFPQIHIFFPIKNMKVGLGIVLVHL